MSTELLNEIKDLRGFFASQISFLEKDGLTLYLKKNQFDSYASFKIMFEDVLGFHDTGIIGSKVDYVDIGVLGYIHLSHARMYDQEPNDYNQIVFITETHGYKVELIVACKAAVVVKL